MPRQNDRDNHNLRPRPQDGGGDTGAVAKLIHELKYQAQHAERSEARLDSLPFALAAAALILLGL
jgi:hypothetical protein